MKKFSKSIDILNLNVVLYTLSGKHADVAELVDALVLGTSANGVGVRVPSSAPTTYLFELFIEQRDTKINQKIKSG